MRHNIIIAGVPRAGKTSVSKRISALYGYQHINMDALIAAFEQNFPELGINTYAEMPSEEILSNISGRIAPFIDTMLRRGEYSENGRGVVLDVYQLLPADYVKYIDKSQNSIYYFVTAAVSIEERLQLLRRFDTERDYMYGMADEKLLESCGFIVAQSKFIRSECEKYNLPCYETSLGRDKIFEDFLYNELPKSFR